MGIDPLSRGTDARDRISRRDFVAASVGAAVLSGIGAPRPAAASPAGAVVASGRHRVVVSTDIGGTDPDDFQSMVHLLLYADELDLEGLVSSPYGPGRKEHILEVVDRYERDYPNLRSHSSFYPTPDALRAMTVEGATDEADYSGVGRPTAGSEWIVRCARRDDPRPLHLLVWGGIEDLAQVLHDAPDILTKLRVYYIGGPNKKWGVNAYQYIATHHPQLWIVESNSTYRGWFVGGNQMGQWENSGFVRAHVVGRGALGEYFATHLGGSIKMGDSPSVGWLLRGTPDAPYLPGWGGRYVRAWDRPHRVFDRLTTQEDRIEHFGVLELALPLAAAPTAGREARMVIENQELKGYFAPDGTVRFRFSPKDAKTYRYTLRSNVAALDGRTGAVTSVQPDPSAALSPSARWPNWWTDDPSPHPAEGPHQGAKTVSEWREDFLRDFAIRLQRCAAPAAGPTSSTR